MREACRALKFQPKILEFQIFRRENAETVHAYLFNPLMSTNKAVVGPVASKRKNAHQFRDWDKTMKWVNVDVQDNAAEVIVKITDNFENVTGRASGRDYLFYSGKKKFAVILLTKDKVKIRIPTSQNISDPKKLKFKNL